MDGDNENLITFQLSELGKKKEKVEQEPFYGSVVAERCSSVNWKWRLKIYRISKGLPTMLPVSQNTTIARCTSWRMLSTSVTVDVNTLKAWP